MAVQDPAARTLGANGRSADGRIRALAGITGPAVADPTLDLISRIHGFPPVALHLSDGVPRELGDKTQLATVAISGTSNRPLAVFIGSSSALVLASLIGAIAGGSMANVVPAEVLQLIASVGFLVIGLRLLWPMLKGMQEPLGSEQD